MPEFESYFATGGGESALGVGGATPSEYTIEVRFMGGLNDRQKQAFKGAADRWTRAIIGDLPRMRVDGDDIDDLLILARGAPIDGPGRILGQAGPLALRPASAGPAAFLPAKGRMTFDTDDLAKMEQDGTLDDVIAHEMGHVIGVGGTVWQRKNVVQGLGSANPTFVGQSAMVEFGRLISQNARKVPVENEGGPGTAGAHWRDSVFGTELMTGFVGSDTNPLSLLTIASLADLGYQVDRTAADPYELPSQLELAAAGVLNQDEDRGIVLPIIPDELPEG